MNKKSINNIQLSITFIILLVISYFTGIGCPIRFLFGLCCPGCGLTRAYVSLLHGNLTSAFMYHPLFAFPPTVYLIYISNINHKIINTILIIIAVMFLSLYLLRLFGGIFIINNDCFDKFSKLIFIDIKKGFIYKLVNYLLIK